MDKQLTKFYIVRHGQTDGNVSGLLQGHMDIPLNETGRMQAMETAKLLEDVKFDLAFSSDLLRAKETTQLISLKHKLEVQATQLLRERHFGENEGKPYTAIATFDELFQKLTHEEKILARSGTGAENDEEIISRLITFLREVAITHPGKTVLVGTHGGIMRAFLIHLGLLSYQSSFLAIQNAAYFVLESDGVEFFTGEMHNIDLNLKD